LTDQNGGGVWPNASTWMQVESRSRSMSRLLMLFLLGITFTEKWNTDNVLATEVTVEDQLLKGLKLSFDTQFVPQTG